MLPSLAGTTQCLPCRQSLCGTGIRHEGRSGRWNVVMRPYVGAGATANLTSIWRFVYIRDSESTVIRDKDTRLTRPNASHESACRCIRRSFRRLGFLSLPPYWRPRYLHLRRGKQRHLCCMGIEHCKHPHAEVTPPIHALFFNLCVRLSSDQSHACATVHTLDSKMQSSLL